MSKTRELLQAHLEQAPGLAYDPVLEGPAVYYQPPSTVYMQYPCIRYALSRDNPLYADDTTYLAVPRYDVTVIDPDPDSDIPDWVKTLPGVRLERVYTAENLHHWVFTVYHQ